MDTFHVCQFLKDYFGLDVIIWEKACLTPV